MTAQRALTEWHDLVAMARKRGEHLQVIDLARQGLEDHPGDLVLEYNKVLAYARAGATGEAASNLQNLRASGALDAIEDRALRTDFAALEPRLLKDRAYVAAGSPAEAPLALHAAAGYEAVYDATGSYFPLINAATLSFIGGDHPRGQSLARIAIDGAQGDTAGGFWPHATIAEAQLLLGDFRAAEAALGEAVATGVQLDNLATTRRQLAWLCGHLAAGAEMLAALPAPYLLCWEADGPPGAGAVAAWVGMHAAAGLPVLAYGAIIGTADIELAEQLLAAGAHTNLVIASTPAACVEAVARAAGPDWAGRLEAILAAASSVSEVTLEGDSTEATVAAMAAQQAKGLAAMRAAALVTRLHHVRVGPGGVEQAVPTIPALAPASPPTPHDRIPRAFVFGDIKGFSTISEAAHRPFLDCIIGGFADVLSRLDTRVEYVETSGDGIYIVLTNVVDALRCCDGLQQAMDPARLSEVGLPLSLQLRLGAHVGPCARGLDRVTGREKFIGKEVIRTARIEAVTPVGQTYVTEQFAATLHALTPVGHACEYVGWQAMAKGFGHCRMYSLRPTPEILSLLHGGAW